MAVEAVLNYSTIALSGNELGFIGSIFGGICTLVAAWSAVSVASRQSRRDAGYRGSQSGVIGFLVGLLLVSIGAAVYFATQSKTSDAAPDSSGVTTTHPAGPTGASGAAPITLEEASAFVSSYLEISNDPNTADQGWAMFTPAHAIVMNKAGGIEKFNAFWDSVGTVGLQDGKSPHLVVESTSTQAVVEMPLAYQMTVDDDNDGTLDCKTEDDDFTLVRTDGILQIDNAQISPGTAGHCTST